MRIIDISQEVFSCEVYPGDEKPKKEKTKKIEDGDGYNLTVFSMCAHNGTHVDAPYHFYGDGKTIDQIDLSGFVGKCYVARAEGGLSGSQAEEIMKKARSTDPEAAKRILIAGDVTVTIEAARVFSRAGIMLIGNESQSIGPVDKPAEVHYELLRKDIILLEGIRLQCVNEGVYLLSAAPLKLGGSDGAPCRAILIEY
ncbi:MAG: cyclase family protein [Erysipelotrichaceae bacterium]|nr:cyclase family protein [Erysipelotrichaceae bacterium]